MVAKWMDGIMQTPLWIVKLRQLPDRHSPHDGMHCAPLLTGILMMLTQTAHNQICWYAEGAFRDPSPA